MTAGTGTSIIAAIILFFMACPPAALSGGLSPDDIQGMENAFGREDLGGYSGEPPEVRYFYESNERPPPYEGEVTVLSGEPDRPYVTLGRIWLLRKAAREALLDQMKKVAARYGANAVILYTPDPVEKSRGRLLWKGRAVLIR